MNARVYTNTGGDISNLSQLGIVLVLSDPNSGSGILPQSTPFVIKFNRIANTQSIPIHLQVSAIESKLGLNITQLAAIFGISRQQVYKWLKQGVQPQSDLINQRIELLSRWICSIPGDHSVYFGKLAKRYVNSTDTVIDILSQENLSEQQLTKLYHILLPTIKALITA